MAQIPGPPRITGKLELDFAAYVQWLTDFYKAGILEGELLQASGQLSTDDLVEVSNLPDPAATTLAQAQQTANNALILAATNDARLDILEASVGAWEQGQFTITGVAKTAVVPVDQEDTDYFIIALPTAQSGSPAAGARDIVTIAKTVDDFTVTASAAPGGVTSVTYDYLLVR